MIKYLTITTFSNALKVKETRRSLWSGKHLQPSAFWFTPSCLHCKEPFLEYGTPRAFARVRYPLMPEISEVARAVHFLRKYLTGRKIASVFAQDDANVFGKVGTSSTEFIAAMEGKTVLDARQQGKYFWIVMSSPPHPLMHFGMTGWIKFKGDDTTHSYKQGREKKNDSKTLTDDDGDDIMQVDDAASWPPKFCKFNLKMEGNPPCEAAFTDPRRFARIRLVDVPAEEMRKTSPLKENGPDPVVDRDVVTLEWLKETMNGKKVPVKALLLDQTKISGIGNWVADEILYNAKIHPEQYSNTFTDDQIKRLYKSMMYICKTACELLGDSSKFPGDWLMKHRWSKGKKDANVLPKGQKIVHLTVGGRTSAIVPSVQKRIGLVAADVKDDAEVGVGFEEEQSEKSAKPAKHKKNNNSSMTKVVDQEANAEVKAVAARPKTKSRAVRKTANGTRDLEARSTSKKRASGNQIPMDDHSVRRSKRLKGGV